MQSVESEEDFGLVRRLRYTELRRVTWSHSRSRFVLASIASLVAIWARPFTFAPRLSCLAGGIISYRLSATQNILRAQASDDKSGVSATETDDWDLDLGGDLKDDWGTVDEDHDIDGIDGVDPALIASILDSDPKDMPDDTQAEPEAANENVRGRETEPALKTEQDVFSDEQAALLKNIEELRKDGSMSEDVLSDFEKLAKGETPGFEQENSAKMKWKEVPLNDTWNVQIAEVSWATDRLVSMMANTQERDQTTKDILDSGATLWPGGIVLARWLCIQPPIVDLAGRTVLELGAGVGLPGLVAAKLGAKVLLQDMDHYPLQEALESCVKAGVASSVTSLCCDWQELPSQLMAGQEALAPFGQPDVMIGAELLVSEAAAESLAMTLSILLRLPSQVAYIVDSYRRPHRKHFMMHCQSLGLDIQETEIVVWEPEHDWAFEIMPEWTVRLLTIRRM